MRATFFVDTRRVARAPELVRAILAARHDVELHCHHHVRHSEPLWMQLERDRRTALALARVGVVPVAGGRLGCVRTTAPWPSQRVYGLKLVGWTIDTHDWRATTPTPCSSRPRGAACRSVILMHDAVGPGARRTGCSATVELIAPLASEARIAL